MNCEINSIAKIKNGKNTKFSFWEICLRSFLYEHVFINARVFTFLYVVLAIDSILRKNACMI